MIQSRSLGWSEDSPQQAWHQGAPASCLEGPGGRNRATVTPTPVPFLLPTLPPY